MASLSSKLKALFPNVDSSIAWELRNDADERGDYISQWNLDNPQPTEEQLEAADADGDAWEALHRVRKQRLRAYPEIRDQLDQIYHEGIDAWKETIKAVKDANPKPE